jgi:hypothetical protein
MTFVLQYLNGTSDLDGDALPCYTTIDEVDPYALSVGGRMSLR